MAVNEATAYTQVLSEGDDGQEGAAQRTGPEIPSPKKKTKRKRVPKTKTPDEAAGTKPKRVKTAFFLFVDEFRPQFKARTLT